MADTVGTGGPAPTWCPSSHPDAPEAVVLGVRSGDGGRLVYLADPVPAAQVLDAVPDGIEPTRVLRFASHCDSGCAHRRGTDCTLVERVAAAPAADQARPVPRCHLRPRCTWWNQVGVDACHRCPAVSTAHRTDDALSALLADPAATPDQITAWIATHPAPAVTPAPAP